MREVERCPPFSSRIPSELGLSRKEDLLARIVTLATPNNEVQEKRLALSRRLFVTIKKAIPTAEVRPFGSVPCGLDLPTSDLDMRVWHSSPDTDTDGPDSHRHGHGPEDSLVLLDRVKLLIEPLNLGQVTAIRTARVPVLKIDAEDIKCDITFSHNTGVRNTFYLARYTKQYPLLQRLVRLIKYWVRERNLPSANMGGLSSYAWSILAIDCLQRMHRDGFHGSDDRALFQALRSFFETYASMPWRQTVSVRCSHFLEKREKGFARHYVPFVISIEDPNDPEVDLAGKISVSSAILIRTELQRAVHLLRSELRTEPRPSRVLQPVPAPMPPPPPAPAPTDDAELDSTAILFGSIALPLLASDEVPSDCGASAAPVQAQPREAEEKRAGARPVERLFMSAAQCPDDRIETGELYAVFDERCKESYVALAEVVRINRMRQRFEPGPPDNGSSLNKLEDEPLPSCSKADRDAVLWLHIYDRMRYVNTWTVPHTLTASASPGLGSVHEPRSESSTSQVCGTPPASEADEQHASGAAGAVTCEPSGGSGLTDAATGAAAKGRGPVPTLTPSRHPVVLFRKRVHAEVRFRTTAAVCFAVPPHAITALPANIVQVSDPDTAATIAEFDRDFNRAAGLLASSVQPPDMVGLSDRPKGCGSGGGSADKGRFQAHSGHGHWPLHGQRADKASLRPLHSHWSRNSHWNSSKPPARMGTRVHINGLASRPLSIPALVSEPAVDQVVGASAVESSPEVAIATMAPPPPTQADASLGHAPAAAAPSVDGLLSTPPSERLQHRRDTGVMTATDSAHTALPHVAATAELAGDDRLVPVCSQLSAPVLLPAPVPQHCRFAADASRHHAWPVDRSCGS